MKKTMLRPDTLSLSACWLMLIAATGLAPGVWAATTAQQQNDAQQSDARHNDTQHRDASSEPLVLDAAAISAAGLQTDIAAAGVLSDSEPVFGVIAALPNRFYRVEAPFDGLINAVLVQAGQQVQTGQPLVRVTNSATLQSYTVSAPGSGEVLSVAVNAGEKTNGRPLLEIADLTEVQVELSVFPSVLARLTPGAAVLVRDLHGQFKSRSTISYIAPQMTEGHIARARARLTNASGDSAAPVWRPGMHVQADLLLNQQQVALRVRRAALQQLAGQTVVFVEQTDEPVHPQHNLPHKPQQPAQANQPDANGHSPADPVHSQTGHSQTQPSQTAHSETNHHDAGHNDTDHNDTGHTDTDHHPPHHAGSAVRTFWPVPVQVLQQDRDYAAVQPLSAQPAADNRQPRLRAGSHYVSQQSFLLKAELGKAAASHQH